MSSPKRPRTCDTTSQTEDGKYNNEGEESKADSPKKECPWQTDNEGDCGTPMDIELNELNEGDVTSIKGNLSVDFLLEVVNDREWSLVRHFLNDYKPFVWKYVCEGNVYYVAKGKKDYLAVVRTSQGATKADGSTLVTREAIKLFKPKIVIAVGVAFGTPYDLTKEIDPDNFEENKNLRMGDVLVSSVIFPTDHKKVKGGEQKSRGTPRHAPDDVETALREAATEWNQKNQARKIKGGIKGPENSSDDERAKAYVGCMMSGNTLMSDEQYHKDALSMAKKVGCYPLGGEMEGAGAADAISGSGVTRCVLIIKAICDWGTGGKGDAFQTAAAYAAFDFLKFVLEKGAAEKILSMSPRLLSNQDNFPAVEFTKLPEKAQEEMKNCLDDLIKADEEFREEERALNDNQKYKELLDKEKRIKGEKAEMQIQRKKADEKRSEAAKKLKEKWEENCFVNEIKYDNKSVKRKFDTAFPPTVADVEQCFKEELTKLRNQIAERKGPSFEIAK